MLYYDNAATTKMYDECSEIISKINTDHYFNPSALYKNSLEVSRIMEDARAIIASGLNVMPSELYFTSSGTESDNIALKGVRKKKGGNIIISAMEHSAVLKTALELAKSGMELKIAPVDSYGRVIEDKFLSLIDDNTSIVSIIHASNETGAVNDIVSLSKKAKSINKNLVFHSDGVQALGKVKISLAYSHVDMYSVSGHKIHAPKGIGALYIKKGLNITPLFHGGGQEKGVRPSTENVAYIAAFAAAFQNFYNMYEVYNNKMYSIKKDIIDKLNDMQDSIIINSPLESTLNNILSIAFNGINGETLLHSLENRDILVGIGSACSSKSKDKKISAALNLPNNYQDGVIRLSFSAFNDINDNQLLCNAIKDEYNKIIKK